MNIGKILAHISCSDLAQSSDWYSRLFGRQHDVSPMDTLHEWHHGQNTGLQLFLNAKAAGKSTVTLVVSDLDANRQLFVDHQLEPGEIEEGDSARFVRLYDPDGNLVVIAQPKQN
tara:strand:+ start:10888 stop:11232 length:345 start_codon:yes stop_codon:yes gene_type:complete